MIGSFKAEVDGKIMTGFLGLRPTRYALFCTVMKHNTRNIRAQKKYSEKEQMDMITTIKH